MLARELAQPTSSAPSWSDFEWRIARAVVAIHGVAPLLAGTLQWRGPPGWNELLADQRNQTVLRHSRIQQLLQRVDEGARARNIPAVALKGAELHSRGLYRPGDRPMADVDLLVRPLDSDRTSSMLESFGFHLHLVTRRERVFVEGVPRAPTSLGEQSSNCLKIELHAKIRESLPLTIVDVSPRILPRHAQPGLNPYASRGALMTHLLLHAAGAIVMRSARLLHLHDIALLCSCMTDEDWHEVLRPNESSERPWWAFPPLQLTARYYRPLVPQRVLSTLAAECPRLLRILASRQRLSDVSLSRLRIDAFPGIEWARSSAEMASYVLTRLRPSSELLELRTHLGQTHPAVMRSPWHRLSQGRRVLRWVLSRPTRDVAMYAVRMAFDQPK